MVQSAQEFLPLQQVLAALEGGVHLAVVAGELRQTEEQAAIGHAAQQATRHVCTDDREEEEGEVQLVDFQFEF